MKHTCVSVSQRDDTNSGSPPGDLGEGYDINMVNKTLVLVSYSFAVFFISRGIKYKRKKPVK